MRILAFFLGMTAVTGACAGEYDMPYRDGDATTAQLVFESRFGSAPGTPAVRSFQLQVASEAQRADGLVPLRAEYRLNGGRFGASQFLVNGLDVERAFASNQAEEGGLAAAWGGWLPLVVVIGAASLIVVDGQDQETAGSGAN